MGRHVSIKQLSKPIIRFGYNNIVANVKGCFFGGGVPVLCLIIQEGAMNFHIWDEAHPDYESQ